MGIRCRYPRRCSLVGLIYRRFEGRCATIAGGFVAQSLTRPVIILSRGMRCWAISRLLLKRFFSFFSPSFLIFFFFFFWKKLREIILTNWKVVIRWVFIYYDNSCKSEFIRSNVLFKTVIFSFLENYFQSFPNIMRKDLTQMKIF